MTRKSDGEKIDDLDKLVARQVERLDGTIGSVDRLTATQEKVGAVVHDLRRETDREIALLKREVEELKKWKEELKREREEQTRRAWAFGPNVVGAIVNVLLGALVAFLVARR